MVRIYKLEPHSRQEIENHLDATSDIMVRAYTLRELSFLDGVDTRTVKTSGKYIPVRVEGKDYRYYQRMGLNRKGYSIKYLRVDEIKHIFNRRNRITRLVEEYR